MDTISFNVHDIASPFDDESSVFDEFSDWLQNVAKAENVQVSDLSYVFVSDDFLLEMNQKHLNHDTYTDILTFDLSDDPTSDIIEAEIYISIDRVKDNALKFNVSFIQELKRVIVHGLLHLIGYDDHLEQDKLLMREKENLYIAKSL